MELSHPLVRVPFEQVSRNFRLYHKQLTRELAHVRAQLGALEKAESRHCLDIDTAVETVAEIAATLRNLKHCVSHNGLKQFDDLASCVKRARSLKTLHQSTDRAEGSGGTLLREEKALHDRLIADYLLGQGHLQSGTLVADTKNLTSLVDHELYAERHAVQTDLRAFQTTTALAWCAQNGTRLRRLQSLLELRLRVQDFIELVRAREPLEAVQYARAYFSSLALQPDDQVIRDAAINDVQTALATLAFEAPETCGIAAYEQLFAADRWLMLDKMFCKTFNKVYEMHDPPSLCIALHAGLSTLNTRACHRIRSANAKAVLSTNGTPRSKRSRQEREGGADNGTGNNKEIGAASDEGSIGLSAAFEAKSDDSDNSGQVAAGCNKRVHACAEPPVPICPACSEVGSQLCTGLPFAYHPHSRLVCRVTQSVMDEHNPPLVLPNGRVYSKRGIELLTQQSASGKIRCVDTHEEFSPGDVKPVYIL